MRSDDFAGRSLLLVEDDERFRGELAAALRERGLDVVEADGVAAAIAAGSLRRFDYAVVDLRLGADSGLDVLRALDLPASGARAVVLTGWGSIATALEAVRAGAIDFVAKPTTVAKLLAALAGTSDATPAADVPALATPSLDRVEWEHIQRVLTASEGNVSRAARELGLHRRSLQRKLRKRPPKR